MGCDVMTGSHPEPYGRRKIGRIVLIENPNHHTTTNERETQWLEPIPPLATSAANAVTAIEHYVQPLYATTAIQ
tara:strand:+ start:240 stop:461 length:222 start_codon:yes stop_codon:yes gene_type:complete